MFDGISNWWNSLWGKKKEEKKKPVVVQQPNKPANTTTLQPTKPQSLLQPQQTTTPLLEQGKAKPLSLAPSDTNAKVLAPKVTQPATTPKVQTWKNRVPVGQSLTEQDIARLPKETQVKARIYNANPRDPRVSGVDPAEFGYKADSVQKQLPDFAKPKEVVPLHQQKQPDISIQPKKPVAAPQTGNKPANPVMDWLNINSRENRARSANNARIGNDISTNSANLVDSVLGEKGNGKFDSWKDVPRFIGNLPAGMISGVMNAPNNFNEAITGKRTIVDDKGNFKSESDLTAQQRLAAGLVGAIDVGGLTLGGTGKLFKEALRAPVRELGKDAAATTAKNAVKSNIAKSPVKEFAKNSLTEGVEEGVQQAAQDIQADSKFDENSLRNIATATALGTAGGAVFDVTGRGIGKVKDTVANRRDSNAPTVTQVAPQTDSEKAAAIQHGVVTPATKHMSVDEKVQTALNSDIGEQVRYRQSVTAYHGSPNDFNDFDMSMAGSSNDLGYAGRGAYFTDNKAIARQYADGNVWGGEPTRTGYLKEAELAMDNPLVVDSYGEIGEKLGIAGVGLMKNTDEHSAIIPARAKQLGYDGIVIRDSDPETGQTANEYVVFGSNQINNLRTANRLGQPGENITRSDMQNIQLENNRMFGDDSPNVEFRDGVMLTPDSQTAIGSTTDTPIGHSKIAIARQQGDPNATYLHEATHKALNDYMTLEERTQVLISYATDNRVNENTSEHDIEELMAEDFIQYAAARNNKDIPAPRLTDRVKEVFEKLFKRLQLVTAKMLRSGEATPEYKQFYNDLYSGKFANEPVIDKRLRDANAERLQLQEHRDMLQKQFDNTPDGPSRRAISEQIADVNRQLREAPRSNLKESIAYRVAPDQAPQYRQLPQDLRQAVDEKIQNDYPELFEHYDTQEFPDGLPKLHPDDIKEISGMTARELGIPPRYVSRKAARLDAQAAQYEHGRGNTNGELQIDRDEYLLRWTNELDRRKALTEADKTVRDLRNDPSVIAEAQKLRAERSPAQEPAQVPQTQGVAAAKAPNVKFTDAAENSQQIQVARTTQAIEQALRNPNTNVDQLIDMVSDTDNGGLIDRKQAVKIARDVAERVGLDISTGYPIKTDQAKNTAWLGDDMGNAAPLDELATTSEALKLPRDVMGRENAVIVQSSKFQDKFAYRDPQDGKVKTFITEKNANGKSKQYEWGANAPIKSDASVRAIDELLDDAAINRAIVDARQSGLGQTYIWKYNGNMDDIPGLTSTPNNPGGNGKFAPEVFDPARHYIDNHKAVDRRTGEVVGNIVQIDKTGAVRVIAGKQNVTYPEWFDINKLSIPDGGKIRSFMRLDNKSTERVIKHVLTKGIKDPDLKKKYMDFLRNELLNPGFEADAAKLTEMNALEAQGKAYNKAIDKSFGHNAAEYKKDLSRWMEGVLSVDEATANKWRAESRDMTLNELQGRLDEAGEAGRASDVRRLQKQINAIVNGEPPKKLLKLWEGREAKLLSNQEVQDRLLREKYGDVGVQIAQKFDDFRKTIYDNLFHRMNEQLVAQGKQPLDYRENYQTFMREYKKAGSSILGVLGDLARDGQRGGLSAALTGKTEYFKPTHRWMPFAMTRHGMELPSDPVGNLLRYGDISLDVIHRAPVVERMRTFEVMLEAKEALGNADMVMPDHIKKQRGKEGRAAREEWQAQVQALRESSAKNAGALRGWVTELANANSGKSGAVDRPILNMLGGRQVLSAVNALSNTVARAYIVANPGTVIKQTASVVNTLATSPVGTAKAVAYMLRGDTLRHRRAISHNLNQTTNSQVANILGLQHTTEEATTAPRPLWADSPAMRTLMEPNLSTNRELSKVDQILGAPLGGMDKIVKELQFNAQYYRAKDAGMGHRAAIDYAEQQTNLLFQFRNKSNRAQIYNQQTFNATLLKFTTEASESIMHFTQDMTWKQRGIAVVLAFVAAEGMKELIGSAATPDPIGAALDAGGEIEEKGWDGVVPAGQRLASELLKATPKVGNLVSTLPQETREKWFGDNDPGRYAGGVTAIAPIVSGTDAAGNITKYIKGEENEETGEITRDTDDLIKGVGGFAQAAGVRGSGQLTRMARGANKVAGGEADNGYEATKGVVFGPNAMKPDTALRGLIGKVTNTPTTSSALFDNMTAAERATYNAVKKGDGIPAANEYFRAVKTQNTAEKQAKSGDSSAAAIIENAKAKKKILDGTWKEQDGLIVDKEGKIARDYYKAMASAAPEGSDEAYKAYMYGYGLDNGTGYDLDKGDATSENPLDKLKAAEERTGSGNSLASNAIALVKGGDKYKDVPDWVKDKFYDDAGWTKEQVEYGAYASYKTGPKLEAYWRPIASDLDHDALMGKLKQGRTKSIAGEYLANDAVVTAMYNEGYISKDEMRYLKNLTIDSEGNEKLKSSSTGSGRRKGTNANGVTASDITNFLKPGKSSPGLDVADIMRKYGATKFATAKPVARQVAMRSMSAKRAATGKGAQRKRMI